MSFSNVCRDARLSGLFALLSLTACGGSGISHAPPAATLTPFPAQLTVTAVANAVPPGAANLTVTGQIRIVLGTGSTDIFRLSARSNGNAITSVKFTAVNGVGMLDLSFKDPGILGLGTYSDSVVVGVCTDSSCTKLRSETEVTIPVTYVVTVTATATLSASATTTVTGQAVTLTWTSTNAQACTASGDWSGPLSASGSQTVTPVTPGAHTYTISCSDPGSEARARQTITAVRPALSFAAFPAHVALGKKTTLRWQDSPATGCVASGDWSGALPATGFQTLSPTTQGTTHYHLVCSNTASSDQGDASITVEPAPALPAATAYRMNEAHDGVLVASGLAAYPSQPAPTWTRDLGAPVSYPLVTPGAVFVTTANPDGSYGSRLYALDPQTGAILWGPVAVSGKGFGSGLTFENGRIFLLMLDGSMHAFDASNGAALWTIQVPGALYSTAPYTASPNAYGGVVFISGGDGLSAVDEVNGTLLWNTAGGASNAASPTVSSEGVYMPSGSGCGAGEFDPVLGSSLWSTQVSCAAPLGGTSIIKNGILFARLHDALALFDSTTGISQGQITSAGPPAITDTAVIALNAGSLSSTRLSDLAQAWSFSGDGSLITAPIVVNSTVFIGSGSGNIYAVDAANGTQLWVGVSPAPITADFEGGGSRPPSGPAAGENLLIFEAGTSLVAWQLH